MQDTPFRAINFSAGPAAMPLAALDQCREELLSLSGSGISVLEHSHRGPEYEEVHEEALSRLRTLGSVPETHEILLLQGGASQHFAQVAMNLLSQGSSADYVLTGGWSEKAYEEAQRVGALLGGKVRVAATTRDADGRYHRIPAQAELEVDPEAAYLHVTTNNTLFGTQWSYTPESHGVPLVADMSSDFFWAPRDLSRYALTYAGAQKNLGPSGLVVVLVQKDLLARTRKDLPVIFRYETHAKNRSLYHTPNTFGIYMLRNVLRWVDSLGGLGAMEQRNRFKAAHVYAALDAHPGVYSVPAQGADRSPMNVVWRMVTPWHEEKFLSEARARNMVGLKGHRSVGGLRASLYNAVEPAHAELLAELLHEFAREVG